MRESVFGVASLCREAAETMALLDAVMDGLTNEDSGALRDLCATQVSFHHSSNHVCVCRQGASFALFTTLPFLCKHLVINGAQCHTTLQPRYACLFCVTR